MRRPGESLRPDGMDLTHFGPKSCQIGTFRAEMRCQIGACRIDSCRHPARARGSRARTSRARPPESSTPHSHARSPSLTLVLGKLSGFINIAALIPGDARACAVQYAPSCAAVYDSAPSPPRLRGLPRWIELRLAHKLSVALSTAHLLMKFQSARSRTMALRRGSQRAVVRVLRCTPSCAASTTSPPSRPPFLHLVSSSVP
jgi:hypothetical protein